MRSDYKLTTKLSSVALLAGALVLQGCDSNDDAPAAVDGGSGTPTLDIPDTSNGTVLVRVRDANGTLVDQATVLVIDDANNGNIVVDELEQSLTTSGLARLRLNAFFGSSELRLEVEKAGFLSNGGRFNIQSSTQNSLNIVLVSATGSAAGIEVAEAAANLSAGDLTAQAMDANNGNELLTSVRVPQNTTVLAADGTELNDDLTMTVAHFKSTDEEALNAFPGGFNVNIENAADIDVNSIEGARPTDSNVVFQSAGFTAIEIFDSNGNKADTFDGEGIDVTMDIPAGTINPETSQPIGPGDVIPVWSFDTDTANWNYEGTAPAQADGNGGLQVSYKATHLSFWNLDFFADDTCSPTVNLDVFEGGIASANPPISVYLLANGSRVNGTMNGNDFTFDAIAQSTNVSLVIQSTNGNSDISVTRDGSLYTGQTFDACTGSNSFNVQLPATEIADINVSVVGVCGNAADTRTPISGASVDFILNSSAQTFNAVTNASGNAVIRGVPTLIPGSLLVSGLDDGFQSVGGVSAGDTVPVELVQSNCTIVTGVTGQ